LRIAFSQLGSAPLQTNSAIFPTGESNIYFSARIKAFFDKDGEKLEIFSTGSTIPVASFENSEYSE
jgi:hypothetical protein